MFEHYFISYTYNGSQPWYPYIGNERKPFVLPSKLGLRKTNCKHSGTPFFCSTAYLFVLRHLPLFFIRSGLVFIGLLVFFFKQKTAYEI